MKQHSHIRASPAATGVSTAYKAMSEAAAFYLKRGGPQVAREHVDRLAGCLTFYEDCAAAYHEVLAEIDDVERQLRREAEEQRQQEMRDMVMAVMGALKPAAPSAPSAQPRATERVTEPGVLPPQLQTERALRMWQKVQGAGLIDDDYLPAKLSRTEAALLADEMATRLGIRAKWKVFEQLWGRKNMRSDYNDALDLRKTGDFRKKINSLLSGL